MVSKEIANKVHCLIAITFSVAFIYFANQGKAMSGDLQEEFIGDSLLFDQSWKNNLCVYIASTILVWFVNTVDGFRRYDNSKNDKGILIG